MNPVFHWSFDPIAFSIGPLAVHWYGLCWMLAFLQGQMLTQRLLRALGRGDVDVGSLMMYALIGAIVGARLTHCLFYDPAYYLSHPWKILAVWEGGMASHGGAVGLIAALFLAAPRYARGLPFLTLLDAIAIPSAIGGAIIRVANFLNSEIVGRPTDGAWGVVFDQVDSLPRDPVQLFEALCYVVTALLLWDWQRRRETWASPGQLTGLFLVLVFIARFALEIIKTPQASYEAGQVVTVGQWLSVPFIVIGLFMIWRSKRRSTALES